ncbi:MAG: OsmC family protein [Longimicrobiales bacterium]
MNAKVIWHEGLSFTGSADSGFELSLGADPGVGGKDDGFRPMELMALSLAGCTAMDVISIMNKKRQDVRAFQVRVRAQRAEEHPKVFTEAVIEYEFTGHDIQEAAVRRSIQLSAEQYCPAQSMLAKVIPIRLDYSIFQGASVEDRSLATRGTWAPEE